MKRQMIFLALAVLITFTLMGPAQAKGEEQTQLPPQTSKMAVLINNETGQRFELPVVTTRNQMIGQDSFEVQYQVEIPKAILLGRSYDERARIDPTASARVTIHMNYRQKYTQGTEYVAVVNSRT